MSSAHLAHSQTLSPSHGLGLCALLFTAALQAQTVEPVLTLNSVNNNTASLTLKAPPGAYSIQVTTNLELNSWSDVLLPILSDGSSAPTSFTLPTYGSPRLFFRTARRNPDTSVQIETIGATFAPQISSTNGNSLLWRWSDGTTTMAMPSASKTFDSAALRQQTLEQYDPAQITKINLGFGGHDGGESTPLAHIPPQNVSAVTFPKPLTSLTCWGSSQNPQLRSLDFTGFTSLQYIECFNCTNMEHIKVSDLPALRRLCVEDCDLAELDLSGMPNLEDVRGALNKYTSIQVDRGTGPKLRHLCIRDNPQINQNFAAAFTAFTALEELLIWNTNQSGDLDFTSMVLTEVLAADNFYTRANLRNRTRLRQCHIYNNRLESIDLAGCTSLRELNASNNRLQSIDLTDCTALNYLNLARNQLTTVAIDSILASLVNRSPQLQNLILTENPGPASSQGIANAQLLRDRGVNVEIDLPPENDGRFDVPGGANAITFTTNSRSSAMEIQLNGPATIIWHWGDGTITHNRISTHTFSTAASHTNYVEVIPASAVTYFGARSGHTQQGITGVIGAANFPNLNFLYLYQEPLTVLDIAGCSMLTQLHFANTLVSSSVCDKWFIDLDAAVPGPVTNADFFFPSASRTSASNSAYQSLIAKGYQMHAY